MTDLMGAEQRRVQEEKN